MNSRLLTPEEVAQRLQVSRITVMNHLRSGALKGVKVGRLWRISEDALTAFCSPPSWDLAHVSDAAAGQPQAVTSDTCRDSMPVKYGVEGLTSDDLDGRWVDSIWDRPLPEFDWGPDGIPATRPVRYIPGKGLVIEGGRRDEPR